MRLFFLFSAAIFLLGCSGEKSKIARFVENKSTEALEAGIKGKPFEPLISKIRAKASIKSISDGHFDGEVSVMFDTADALVVRGEEPDFDFSTYVTKANQIREECESAAAVSFPEIIGGDLYSAVPAIGRVLSLPRGTTFTFIFRVKGTHTETDINLVSHDLISVSPAIDDSAKPAASFPGQKIFDSQKLFKAAYLGVAKKASESFLAKREKEMRAVVKQTQDAMGMFSDGAKYSAEYPFRKRTISVILEVVKSNFANGTFEAVVYDAENPEFRKSWFGTLSRDPLTGFLDGKSISLVGDELGMVQQGREAPILFEFGARTLTFRVDGKRLVSEDGAPEKIVFARK